MARELCEMIDVVTNQTPVVLVVEDLQWADDPTLDVLSAIARGRESAKLLILCTFSHGASIAAASSLDRLTQDLLFHRLAHELKLEGLDEIGIRSYLAGKFTDNDFDSGLASLIHRYSGGNPLFMAELLDGLVRRRLLIRPARRWTMTMPLEEIAQVLSDLGRTLDLQLKFSTEANQHKRIA
jgi:predicted ATPase